MSKRVLEVMQSRKLGKQIHSIIKLNNTLAQFTPSQLFFEDKLTLNIHLKEK